MRNRTRILWWLGTVFILVAVAGSCWRIEDSSVAVDLLKREASHCVGLSPGKLLCDVSAMRPSEQADYWVQCISKLRLEELSSNDLVAIATLLSRPQSGYLSRMLKPTTRSTPASSVASNSLPIQAMVELDQNGIAVEESLFHARVATNREVMLSRLEAILPEHPDLASTLAVLEIRQATQNFEFLPLSKSWESRFARCREVDPDNALYDLLAASFFFDQCGTMNYEEARGKILPTVVDQETEERAWKLLADGLERKGCRPPLNSAICLYNWLLAIGYSRVEALATAYELSLSSELIKNQALLARQMNAFANLFVQQGQVKQGFGVRKDQLRIAALLADTDPVIVDMVQSNGMFNLLKLKQQYPELVDSMSLPTVAEYRKANIEFRLVHQAAQRRIVESHGVPIERRTSVSGFSSMYWLVRAILGILVSVAMALVLTLWKKIRTPELRLTLGVHALCCLVAVVIGGVFAIVLPMADVPATGRTWTLRVVGAACIVCFAAWGLDNANAIAEMSSRQKCRRLIALVVTLWGLSLCLIDVSGAGFEIRQVLPEFFEDTLTRQGVSWLIPVMTWLGWGGPAVTAILWVHLIGFCVARQVVSSLNRISHDEPHNISLAAGILSNLKGPVLIVSIGMLFFFLCFWPAEVNKVARYYHFDRLLALSPREYQRLLTEEESRIRSDMEAMAEITKSAEKELSNVAW